MGFRVSGFRLGYWRLKFRVSGFEFLVFWFSGFVVSGFGFRVSGAGFRISGFRIRVSGVGFRFRFQVSGFTGRGIPPPPRPPTPARPTRHQALPHPHPLHRSSGHEPLPNRRLEPFCFPGYGALPRGAGRIVLGGAPATLQPRPPANDREREGSLLTTYLSESTESSILLL